jgi:hypothetical protein
MYYMVGKSGARYYVSPDHEGGGVMLVDANPKDKSPDKERPHFLLQGQPPVGVTIDEACEIPGLRKVTEPIRMVIIYTGKHSEWSSPSQNERQQIQGHPNPFVTVYDEFDAALAKDL